MLGILAGVLVALWIGLLAAPRADAYIYWASLDGNIGRANVDGTGVENGFITGLFAPAGLSVNSSRLYWGTTNGGTTIGRSNTDGTAANPSFIGGTSQAFGVAVAGSQVYWTNNTAASSSIGRANLDGSAANPTFIDLGPPSLVSGVAVDASHIYWSSAYHHAIQEADLAGNTKGNLLSFGAGTVACCVAVDATHLYWGEFSGGNGSIGRANLDGSSPNETFIGGLDRITGLAVYGGHIYWSNSGDRAAVANHIGRANVDGTDVNQTFVGVGNPSGLAVDSRGNAVLLRVPRCVSLRICAVRVHIPDLGRIEFAGKGIRRAARTATGAGNLKVKLHTRNKLSSALDSHGRAKVRLRITFTPAGSLPTTVADKVKLRAP